jgi:hypothetical protein
MRIMKSTTRHLLGSVGQDERAWGLEDSIQPKAETWGDTNLLGPDRDAMNQWLSDTL